ncbi:hypothetical protein Pmani_031222 [Petrolisthes manimaculis]|uniref:Uncharacterized protein n=1 Tax=Petrolisthes manimaculis TaxID=1843537 RepID=A0AAE1NU51_9EUCA|nr:hypothetical protein Pmani_031222 [Petrolisthes manimaculis]
MSALAIVTGSANVSGSVHHITHLRGTNKTQVRAPMCVPQRLRVTRGEVTRPHSSIFPCRQRRPHPHYRC